MSQRTFFICLFAILVVVILGSTLDVMEVDAAQYAGMSRDMMLRGDILKLFYRDVDYLDKPPLLFWSSALSFRLFGVHNWAYRIPSIFFAFLGVFSTYRFSSLYHGSAVARIASLMFGSSVAFFVMTNDVRCDTILTGCVITAVWLGCAWLEQGRPWQALVFGVAVAAGMLAKGPIGAMAPLLAVGAQLVFTRKWHRLKDPIIVVVFVWVGLLLVPMCIGLYQQHGAHGLRFYFWEQSFGRITGENRWKDDSTIFYFAHELLWQVLPWTLFIVLGLWNAIRGMVQRRPLTDHASTLGSVLIFVALSLSHFKLPHYLFVTLPLFSIVGGVALVKGDHTRLVMVGQRGLTLLLLVLGMIVTWVAFPDNRWLFLLVQIGVAAFIALQWMKGPDRSATFLASFGVVVSLGFVMNAYFYPGLLSYQANARAGQWAAEHEKGLGMFYSMQVSGGAMDFYAGYPVPWISDAREARNVIHRGVVIYTDSVHRQKLIEAGLVPTQETMLLNHPAQRLSLSFLDPVSRPSELEERFLLQY